MHGSELVKLWEQQHGQLPVESQLRFLASVEAQKIRAAPAEQVRLALKRTPILSEVLSDLINTGFLDPEEPGTAARGTSAANQHKTQPSFTRKIASEGGRGFLQAEEDARKWRGRF